MRRAGATAARRYTPVPVTLSDPTPEEPRAPSREQTSDALLSVLTGDGQMSVRALAATDLVAHTTRLRSMSPTAATALARGLMGALLLAAGKPDDESLQIQARGSGPLGSILAIADAGGSVRGTVSNPLAEAPGQDPRVDVAATLGRGGLLSVIRSSPRFREPYRGVVPLETGEIARDLTRYLFESEQVPSALGLSILLGSEGQIESAGGFLVQALPDASDETVARVEDNIAGLPRAAEVVKLGGVDALVARITDGLGTTAESRVAPVFHCPCTRERARRSLILLQPDELREIAEGTQPQEVGCEFCGRHYQLTPEEVRTLVPGDAPDGRG